MSPRSTLNTGLLLQVNGFAGTLGGRQLHAMCLARRQQRRQARQPYVLQLRKDPLRAAEG